MSNVIPIQKPKDQAMEVLDFLNEKAGTHYKPTTRNLSFILKRLEEGYTVQELRAVVAMKYREWKNDPVLEVICTQKHNRNI